MHPHDFRQRLRGVMAFAMTPFTEADEVDFDGLAAHVDFLCRNQVPCVVVCGGVGEFFSLDDDEYRGVIRTAVEAAAGRMLVVVGVGHGTRVARRLATYAASVGADGLMIHPPYSSNFVQPSDDGMLAHYSGLADASSLGMIVFSTKSLPCSGALLERLSDIPAVVALKDEHGDLRRFGEMVEQHGTRYAWICGMAETLAGPYAAAGAQAITSGIANIAPQISLSAWRAATTNDWPALRRLVADSIRPISDLRERRNGYQVAVIKESMNLLGRPGGGVVRPPIVPLTESDRRDLEGILVQMGLSPRLSVTPPLQADRV